jgi:hypothetical protein
MPTKSILLSKTFWFNFVTGLLSALAAADVTAILPATLLKYVPAILVIGNIVLRYLSDGSKVEARLPKQVPASSVRGLDARTGNTSDAKTMIWR